MLAGNRPGVMTAYLAARDTGDYLYAPHETQRMTECNIELLRTYCS
jgi:hypothetical protein